MSSESPKSLTRLRIWNFRSQRIVSDTTPDELQNKEREGRENPEEPYLLVEVFPNGSYDNISQINGTYHGNETVNIELKEEELFGLLHQIVGDGETLISRVSSYVTTLDPDRMPQGPNPENVIIIDLAIYLVILELVRRKVIEFPFQCPVDKVTAEAVSWEVIGYFDFLFDILRQKKKMTNWLEQLAMITYWYDLFTHNEPPAIQRLLPEVITYIISTDSPSPSPTSTISSELVAKIESKLTLVETLEQRLHQLEKEIAEIKRHLGGIPTLEQWKSLNTKVDAFSSLLSQVLGSRNLRR
jgi:hypothetical protein